MYDQNPNRREFFNYRSAWANFGGIANGVNADGAVAVAISGTAAAITNATGTQINVGGAVLTTGTTTTGYASITSQAALLLLGGGKAQFRAKINFSALPDGTNTYDLFVGFIDSGSVEASDGVYLHIAFVSSALQVRCKCRKAAGTADYVDVSTLKLADPVTYKVGTTSWTAATEYDLRIEISSDDKFARFFINGTMIGELISSQIPITTGQETGFGVLILKSAGATARTVTVSNVNVRKEHAVHG